MWLLVLVWLVTLRCGTGSSRCVVRLDLDRSQANVRAQNRYSVT